MEARTLAWYRGLGVTAERLLTDEVVRAWEGKRPRDRSATPLRARFHEEVVGTAPSRRLCRL